MLWSREGYSKASFSWSSRETCAYSVVCGQRLCDLASASEHRGSYPYLGIAGKHCWKAKDSQNKKENEETKGGRRCECSSIRSFAHGILPMRNRILLY